MEGLVRWRPVDPDAIQERPAAADLAPDRFGSAGGGVPPQKKYTNTGYAPRDWVGEHILLWRKAHGRVLRGKCVVFKDGDKQNITLGNLELISRRQLMARNTIHHLPPELKSVIRAKASLTRTIRRLAREE